MRKNIDKYLKSVPGERNHKVTSVNLDKSHFAVLSEKEIKISALVRDLLEDFLLQNFPVELNREKKKRGGK